jgi:hypothetical protein
LAQASSAAAEALLFNSGEVLVTRFACNHQPKKIFFDGALSHRGAITIAI